MGTIAHPLFSLSLALSPANVLVVQCVCSNFEALVKERLIITASAPPMGQPCLSVLLLLGLLLMIIVPHSHVNASLSKGFPSPSVHRQMTWRRGTEPCGPFTL